MNTAEGEWKPSLILKASNQSLPVSSAVQTVKIPLLIMQTWKTKDVPEHWQSGPAALKRLMPHWKYQLLTDDDNNRFVQRYFPDFWPFFSALEYPIQRADAIRYMWLYVMGGLYLDLDLEITKPLDDLFFEDHDLYVVKSSIVENVYTNAFIGAKPRLFVMLQCLEDMKLPYSPWQIGKHLKVINSTGPNMFTRAISKVKLQTESFHPEDETKFSVDELPTELIVACGICDPKPCSAEGGYCRVLGGSSWSGSDTNFLTALYCKRYQLASVLLIIVIMIIVITILFYRKRHCVDLE